MVLCSCWRQWWHIWWCYCSSKSAYRMMHSFLMAPPQSTQHAAPNDARYGSKLRAVATMRQYMHCLPRLSHRSKFIDFCFHRVCSFVTSTVILKVHALHKHRHIYKCISSSPINLIETHNFTIRSNLLMKPFKVREHVRFFFFVVVHFVWLKEDWMAREK